MRTALLISLILLLILVAVAAFASHALSGSWTAQVDGERLHINLVRPRNGMMGFTISIASLGPLTATSLTTPSADVKFALDRAAGTLAFEGQFAGGTGAGHFTFAPSESFVRDMEVLGYRGFRDDDLMLFTTTDFSPATVRGLNAMGYSPTRRQLDDVAIFKITPEYVREIERAGYGELKIRDFTDLRVATITGPKIDEYRALGYRLTLRQLVDFGLHRVTPKYISELRELGYDGVSASQLIEMKIFNVTPEFIRELRANGYTGVPVKKLIAMKMGGAEEIFTGPR